MSEKLLLKPAQILINYLPYITFGVDEIMMGNDEKIITF